MVNNNDNIVTQAYDLFFNALVLNHRQFPTYLFFLRVFKAIIDNGDHRRRYSPELNGVRPASIRSKRRAAVCTCHASGAKRGSAGSAGDFGLTTTADEVLSPT
jgi:hypothetical protein